MDTGGVGAQARGALHTIFQASRATGRTSAMLRTLHDGDLVVFNDSREAKRVHRMAKAMGLDIEVTVCDPRNPHRITEGRGTLQGQLVFDHSWLEEFYLNAIENAYRHTEDLRKHMSGFDDRHARTRLAAQEMAKWSWTEPGGE